MSDERPMSEIQRLGQEFDAAEPKVTQADRDAAAEWMRAVHCPEWSITALTDSDALVLSHARHREQSTAELIEALREAVNLHESANRSTDRPNSHLASRCREWRSLLAKHGASA